MHFTQISQRIFNTPLLMHPDKLEIIVWSLREKLGSNFDIELPEAFDPEKKPEASRFLGSRRTETGDYKLARRSKSVAVIPVIGSLVNRGAWLDSRSGMTSYEGLRAQIQEAAADPDISSIVLDIDSPGGEATGMFSLASTIRAARDKKEVVAVVDDVAASAGFGIASSATRIIVSPTSMVGSIGVVWMHLDRSGELAMQGVRPTLLHAGAEKVVGNSLAPLSEKDRASMQAMVDSFYQQFLETVEAGRPLKLPADKARATEARVYMGQEAIDAGLADEIGTLDAVLSTLSQPTRTSPGATSKRSLRMDADTISLESHKAAVAAARAEGFTAGRTEGHAAGLTDGVKQERDRFLAIMTCEEAKGRETAAAKWAAKGYSLEDAKEILADVAVGAPSAATLAERAAATGADSSPLAKDGGETDAGRTAAKDGWGKAIAQYGGK